MKQKGLSYPQAHTVANAEIPLNKRDLNAPSQEPVIQQQESEPLPNISSSGNGNGPKKPDDDKNRIKFPENEMDRFH